MAAARSTPVPVTIDTWVASRHEREALDALIAWEIYVERLLKHPLLEDAKTGAETRALLVAAQRVRRDRR